MDIKRLGVWYFTDGMTSPEAATFARKVEELGYGALWIPESRGRDCLVHSSWLLSQTQRLVVATGIANIYGRDTQAAASAFHGLNEQSGGRFLLGLGVSHAPLVEDERGHRYKKPLATMREYLEKLKQAPYYAPKSDETSEIVIAAMGPKMLELSAELCDGAHPYNVTPEHTAQARSIIGPNKRLYVEQKLVLDSDPARARALAERYMKMYLALPNYRNNWLRLGFTNEEIDGSSERFLNAMVAWGDVETIAARVREHWEAGADHVCVQPLGGTDGTTPDLKLLEQLADHFQLNA